MFDSSLSPCAPLRIEGSCQAVLQNASLWVEDLTDAPSAIADGSPSRMQDLVIPLEVTVQTQSYIFWKRRM